VTFVTFDQDRHRKLVTQKVTNDASASHGNSVLMRKHNVPDWIEYDERRNKMTQESLKDAETSSEILEKEQEVFPGVIERRCFLKSSLATTAALLVLGAAAQDLSAQDLARTTGGAGADKLGWEDFLKESIAAGKQLFADPSFSLDEYLYRIGSLATRLKEIPETKLYPYTEVEPRVSFAPSFRGSPFFIIQWRMEPGVVFPAHNHPNASVCTLGYEGEARLRNFEIIGEAPEYTSTKTFRLRETHNELVSRGRINTLSPARDNIHQFQVGKEGARGIDISTMHGKMEPFSFLNIGEKPFDPEKRIFEATWRESTQKASAKKVTT